MLKVDQKSTPLIVEAQTLGRADIVLGELSRRVAEAMGLYERHFAGQSRFSRPDTLMVHIQDRLLACRDAMRALEAEDEQAQQEQLHGVDGHLELIAGERREIERLRSDLEPEQLESLMAEIANGWFRWYQVHFASKTRVSRRGEVLELMIAGLEAIASAFAELATKRYGTETLDDNIRVVDERLALYRAELETIREAVELAHPRDRIGALGADANDVMALYREHFAGQDRKTRDLSLIRELCDRLYFTGLEMEDLEEAFGGSHPDNLKNLQIVRKTLTTYHDEYRKIRDVQLPGGSAVGARQPGLDGMVRIRPDFDDE